MIKKIVSLILVGALLLAFGGCHRSEGGTASPDSPTQSGSSSESGQEIQNPQLQKDENYIDYQEKSEPMTKSEAEKVLAKENIDKTDPEYRRAVFTVNSAAAETIILEAQETKTITPEVKQLFDKIAFRFIEGDTFASATVKASLIKQGTCEKGEDGIYYFTFYDQTLAQATTNQEGNSHSIDAYKLVLDLLLNDPNVEVITN